MASFFAQRKVRRAITIAIIVVAVVLVVLEALIVGGILVLNSKGPAPVTIGSVSLKVDEGQTSAGDPWFVPQYVNYTTDDGYPLQVAPGGSWTVDWTFLAVDNVNHTIYSVTVSAPFSLKGTVQTLPMKIAPGSDQGLLGIEVTAPSTAGASYPVVTVTVDAEPSS
jgi:hypothetical protein